LQHRIADAKTEEVEKFLAKYPNTLPAQIMRENFLFELAHRQDWKSFSALYTENEKNRELQCDELQAKLATDKPIDFDTELKPLWLTPKLLPSSCDVAVQWAVAKNKITDALIRERIYAAAQAAQADVVSSSATLLDGANKVAAENIAGALQNPAAT